MKNHEMSTVKRTISAIKLFKPVPKKSHGFTIPGIRGWGFRELKRRKQSKRRSRKTWPGRKPQVFAAWRSHAASSVSALHPVNPKNPVNPVFAEKHRPRLQRHCKKSLFFHIRLEKKGNGTRLLNITPKFKPIKIQERGKKNE